MSYNKTGCGDASHPILTIGGAIHPKVSSVMPRKQTAPVMIEYKSRQGGAAA
jgi:hypothetical protein